jgi:o-succinylbenzoate---CoA ligase
MGGGKPVTGLSMVHFRTLSWQGRKLEGEAIGKAARTLVATHAQAPWTRDLEVLLTELTLHQSALAVHTSGTTGAPKLLRIARSDLVASAQLTQRTFGLKANDAVLLCLPCTYIAGKMMVVRAFVCQLDLYSVPPEGGILRDLPRGVPFRFAAMAPQQLHSAVLQDARRVQAQFGTVLLGGGPISRTLSADLEGLSTQVYHGYGSTETVTHVALTPVNAAARDANLVAPYARPVSRPVLTALHGVRFGQDMRGCLVVHTPHLRQKEHLTNDVVELLDEKNFHWLGRQDHVVLSGGRKFFPEELESRTAGILPYAHYFRSTSDERLGQALVLMVEADKANAAEEEVRALLPSVLTRYELPKKVVVVPRFERTASGKVVRQRD